MTSTEIRIGTASGMCLSIFSQFSIEGLFETILLATVGAAVSFLVGRGLQRLTKNKKK